MDPMRHLMVQIVTGVGTLLALLTLAIVTNKALREMGEALERHRRALLEPAVFEYLGATSSKALLDYLPKSLSRRDRRLVERILLEAASFTKGEARDRITAACESLGSVREAIRGLRSRRWWKRADAAEKLGLMRRSEEHTSELQSRLHLVCRLLLEKKKKLKYSANRAKRTQ